MDNDLKEYISPAELDALLVRLRCGVDTVDAVHVAMTEGHCGADSYTDALFGAIEGLYATVDQLNALCYVRKGDKDA